MTKRKELRETFKKRERRERRENRIKENKEREEQNKLSHCIPLYVALAALHSLPSPSLSSFLSLSLFLSAAPRGSVYAGLTAARAYIGE